MFSFSNDSHCSADSFFFDWIEPALFLTIAFVIRDRYLTYDGNGRNGGNKSGLPLFLFMIASYFLVVSMFTLSTASTALVHVANMDFFKPVINTTEVDALIRDANNLSYASLALYMVATILLIPMAVVARKKTGSEKVCDDHV